MVETQHPAEPLDALDRADCRCRTIAGLDQPIVDSLVISLPVIMRGVLASSSPKRPFSEEDHPIETFILDRSHEPLGVRVLFGAADPVQLSGRFARARLDSDDILLVIRRWNQKTWIELPTRGPITLDVKPSGKRSAGNARCPSTGDAIKPSCRL